MQLPRPEEIMRRASMDGVKTEPDRIWGYDTGLRLMKDSPAFKGLPEEDQRKYAWMTETDYVKDKPYMASTVFGNREPLTVTEEAYGGIKDILSSLKDYVWDQPGGVSNLVFDIPKAAGGALATAGKAITGDDDAQSKIMDLLNAIYSPIETTAYALGDNDALMEKIVSQPTQTAIDAGALATALSGGTGARDLLKEILKKKATHVKALSAGGQPVAALPEGTGMSGVTTPPPIESNINAVHGRYQPPRKALPPGSGTQGVDVPAPIERFGGQMAPGRAQLIELARKLEQITQPTTQKTLPRGIPESIGTDADVLGAYLQRIRAPESDVLVTPPPKGMSILDDIMAQAENTSVLPSIGDAVQSAAQIEEQILNELSNTDRMAIMPMINTENNADNSLLNILRRLR